MATFYYRKLDNRKPFYCALSQTYSFNLQLSSVLQERAGFFLATRTRKIPTSKLKFMELFLKCIKKTRKIGRDLKRTTERDIFFYRTNGSYKGLRMSQNLPCHGQRTKTNAQTNKKRRKFFIALSERAKQKQLKKAQKKTKKNTKKTKKNH